MALIKPASIIFTDGAGPQNKNFDDIYFSREDGLAETEHVFLAANDLPARFAALSKDHFNIGEIGFGCGLNFLATYDLWRRQRANKKPDTATLTFHALEGFPLSEQDFRKNAHNIATQWPHLACLAEKLAHAYPPISPGLHPIVLAPDVRLYLYFQPAEAALENWSEPMDAWFFDGFSPKKNPAMWSLDLFKAAARLSHDKTSFATFSAASQVRENLSKASFSWNRQKGFGRKKHMLAGHFTESPTQPTAAKAWTAMAHHHPSPQPKKRIAIIGAGIAGASLAFHLRLLNQHYHIDLTVYDRDGPAHGGSGNRLALLLPRLDADDSPTAQFYRLSWLYALRLIQQLESDSGERLLDHRGGLHVAKDERIHQRFEKILRAQPLPDTHLVGGALETSPDFAHLRFLKGGTLRPKVLIQALLNGVKQRREKVQRIGPYQQAENHQWQVVTAQSQNLYDQVVIASGANWSLLPQEIATGCTLSIGQVDCLSEGPDLKQALIGGAYMADWDGVKLIGAGYQPCLSDARPQWSPDRATKTLAMIKKFFPPQTQFQIDEKSGRAALRLVTLDQNPIVGPIPDWNFIRDHYQQLIHGDIRGLPLMRYQQGLYILTGLGSRGFSTAPLLGFYLASLMQGTSAPIDMAQMDLLHPSRFFIRAMRHRVKQKK